MKNSPRKKEAAGKNKLAISVIIITKDRVHDLEECLLSLANQTTPCKELIVVDSSLGNGTELLCRKIAKKFRSIIYKKEPRRGFPVARNTGISLSHYPWVAFTDDDCIVDRSWIEELTQMIVKHPTSAAVAGRSESAYPDNPVAYATNLNERYWKSAVGLDGEILDLETLDNKNIAYNIPFLRSHKITYDEQRMDYAGASDDCDIGMQIYRVGGCAYYAEKAVVWHKDPTSLKAYFRNKISRTLAHATYERKWGKFRSSISLSGKKPSKIDYFRRDIETKRIPMGTSVLSASVLLSTFILIRILKWYEDLRMFMKRQKNGMADVLLMGLLTTAFLIMRFASSSGSAANGGFRSTPSQAGNYNNVVDDAAWWSINVHEPVGYAVVAPETVIVGGNNRTVSGVSIGSGKIEWIFRTRTDIPFPPALDGKTAYLLDRKGVMYALDSLTGKELTVERLKITDSASSPPVIDRKSVYVGSTDGTVSSVRIPSETIIWRTKIPGGEIKEIFPAANLIIIQNEKMNLSALDAKTGKRLWSETKNRFHGQVALENNRIFGCSQSGDSVVAVDAVTGKTIWTAGMKTGSSCMVAAGKNGVLVGSENALTMLSQKSGKTLWKTEIAYGSVRQISLNNRFVYISTAGALYAFRFDTGKNVWVYELKSIPETPAYSAKNTLYFGLANGYLYALNAASGSSPVDADVRVTQLFSQVPQFDVAEYAVSLEDARYANPQTEMEIMATFRKSKNGKIYHLRGFYYGKNEWRVRFAPPEAGTWDWTIEVRPSPLDVVKQTGVLEVEKSSLSGFLEISPSDPYRLLDGRGNLFQPVGITDSLLDRDKSGTPFDDLYMDEKKTDLDTYLGTYSRSGFNMFRWGINNVSFNLVGPSAFAVSQTPLIQEGVWGDELISKLRKNNLKILMTLWNIPPLSAEKDITELRTSIDKRQRLKEYLQYVIARYGAYVDIWELANEANVSKDWLDFVVGVMKEEDPYHHLRTISYQTWSQSDKDLTLTAPHWYENEPELESDTKTYDLSFDYRWGKPVIFGEQGNAETNWDDRSAIRMRLRMWTAFFAESGMVFWNSSENHSFKSAYRTSNIYLGEEERAYVSGFRRFADAVPGSAKVVGRVIHPESREYILETDTARYGYLVHATDHNTKTLVSLDQFLHKTGTVTWIDPETGRELETREFNTDNQPVTSPEFTIDLAYRIKWGGK